MTLREGPLRQTEASDPTVQRLADLFADHPVWQDAMTRIRPGATSVVYFNHRPQDTWRLVKTKPGVRLEPGAAARPDFVFCFTPAAVDELAAVSGAIDDVAVALFDLMLSDDPQRRVDFGIVAPFWTLVRHGHLRLVLEAGPKVLAYGAGHGILTLGQLRKFVGALRTGSPEDIRPVADSC